MSRSQAVRRGFESVLKQPEIYLAEMVWRMAFLAVAALVMGYALVGYLDTLPVSDRDLFGLANVIPGTVGPALANVFRGSGPRLVRILLAATLGVAALWWLAASAGRLATLRALLGRESGRPALMLRIHALRLLVMAGAWPALAAAYLLAGAFSRSGGSGHDAARFYLLFLPLAGLVLGLWSSLSGVLMLAPVYAVRDEKGVFAAIGAAAASARERASQFAWVAAAFGFLRWVAWGFGLVVLLTLMGVLSGAPAPVVGLVLLGWALLYAGVTTLLSIARLAAWVRIAEWEGKAAY
jgi:hypothetical protein